MPYRFYTASFPSDGSTSLKLVICLLDHSSQRANGFTKLDILLPSSSTDRIDTAAKA